MNVDREQLRFLAEQPIGAKHLQAEADRIAHLGVEPSGELKETIKRAAKIWLPQGKTMPVRGACNEPEAQQTDLEDAVEAAGGKRGHTLASGIAAATAVETTETGSTGGKSPVANGETPKAKLA